MFTFFRQIRHDLLNNGKIIKYLKYAVGEIILVVIGILIALSINNKNAELAERKAEQIIYENIKEQLMDDIGNFESLMEYNDRYARQFRYAVKLIQTNDKSEIDSLSVIATRLTKYSDFDREGNMYQTMVNSGDIKLVRSNEIIERLRRLEETNNYVNRMENIHYDAVMSLVPTLMKTIRFYTGEVEDEKFLYSYESQNMFVLSLQIMSEKEMVYTRTLEEIDMLLELIETETNHAST